jgi:hypothetical protein
LVEQVVIGKTSFTPIDLLNRSPRLVLKDMKNTPPILTPFAHMHEHGRMKEATLDQPALDKDEYAKRWGISTRKLDELIQEGLPVIKLGHRTVRILTLSADSFLVKKFGTGAKKAAALIFALLCVTVSAFAQGNPPGQTPFPATDDNPLWLRAEKIWGPLPRGATTLQLLSAPILSDQTNMLVGVWGADCGTLGRTLGPILSNSTWIAVYLPAWDQSALAVTMLMSACSNEPNHSVSFSLRAASIANNADLTSPTFGSYVYLTNTLSGANHASLVSFPTLTPGNAGAANTVVLLELARVTDSFTNGVTVAQLGLSYGKNVSQ